ncbi:MAG: hypothetical protein EBU90_06515 [Proteobacteria bacterium]|nr:hypothetical protein [Pseudomonadota bacterium]
MYTVYMTGSNTYSLYNNQSKVYLLSNADFKRTFDYLHNDLEFSKNELVIAFDSLIDNLHNTIEFGNFGTFIYSKYIDFSIC